jgi:hypothetical protein
MTTASGAGCLYAAVLLLSPECGEPRPDSFRLKSHASRMDNLQQQEHEEKIRQKTSTKVFAVK